ncbi:MAG: site-2 protease family protein [Clostridium sp.]
MKKLNFKIMLLVEILLLLYSMFILNRAYNSFLIVISALIIVYYVNTTIHEVGHLFFGLLSGGEFYSLSIGLLKIEKVNNKLKFTLNEDIFAGNCAVFAKNDDIKSSLLSASGGLIFNSITAIILFFTLTYLDLGNYKAFVLVILIDTIYTILSNGIPYLLSENTDGTFIYNIFFKPNFAKAWTELYNVILAIKKGIRPRDIIQKLDYENINDLQLSLTTCMFSYYRALDNSDYKIIEKDIRFLEENLENLPIKKDSYLSEFIYYYSVINKDLDKATNYFEIIKKDLEKDMDINSRRVLAVYYYYIKEDKETAKKHCEDGLNLFSTFPYKGQANLEKDIIETILKQL